MKFLQQILLGLLVAIALLVVLQWWVGREEVADHSVRGGSHREAGADLPADPGPVGRQILRELHGSAAGYALARLPTELPEGCAPVLEICPGGNIRIATAVPLASSPGALHWPRVGILLPQARLGDLSPAERASLVSIWSRLSRTPLHAAAIELPGCQARAGEVDQLLRWLR